MDRVRRVALPLVLLAALTACGSTHTRATTYSGRLYSVAQVEKAFLSVGFKLVRGHDSVPGTVRLGNDPHGSLGASIGAAQDTVTVVVLTRRDAVRRTIPVHGRIRVKRYANVTVYYKRYYGDEVSASLSALRWRWLAQGKPREHLIVLGRSIGLVSLGEPRSAVEKALGPGTEKRRGIVSYFAGHLVVDYWFHDGLYKSVEFLETTSRTFRTRTGIHVGSSRDDLKSLYVGCASRTQCTLQLGPMPDALGMSFGLRRDRVVSIAMGYA